MPFPEQITGQSNEIHWLIEANLSFPLQLEVRSIPGGVYPHALHRRGTGAFVRRGKTSHRGNQQLCTNISCVVGTLTGQVACYRVNSTKDRAAAEWAEESRWDREAEREVRRDTDGFLITASSPFLRSSSIPASVS